MGKRIFLGAAVIDVLVILMPQLHSQAPSIQRDQEALTILAQTITAAGGVDLLVSIRDLTESGTVTYYADDQTTGALTVKSRGLQQVKMDADLSDGPRITVVSGTSGALIQADGAFLPISGQSAADIGSVTFPLAPIIAAIGDPSTSIIYGGLVSHDGASAYDVRIQKSYPVDQDPQGNRGVREARDFYIDPSSFLVVAIADQLFWGEQGGTPHEILYSNYQSQNGVNVPMTITETLRDVTGATMQLTKVTFNSGLTDSDFQW